MDSYIKLTPEIRQAQLSDPVSQDILQLRIPGLAFLLFDVGWNDSSVTLLDMQNGHPIAVAQAQFGYPDLQKVHERYRNALTTAYSSFTRRESHLRATLDALLAEYQNFLGPVLDKFAPLVEGWHLKIFPRAQLNAVPLHALKAGGRYLLEYCTISYGQTLGLFVKLHERQKADSGPLKVATIYSDRGLPFYEAVAVRLDANFQGRHRLLRNPSLDSLLKVVDSEHPSDLLFACHGIYEHDDPGKSMLEFGAPEGTSLWRVLSDVDLAGCRAVILGVCESGLARCQVDAEYMGFPGAFHAAGADYVVGTLWQVNQLATAILLDRYFDLVAAGQARPDALRRAQLDLTTTSIDAILEWVRLNCFAQPVAGMKYLGALCRFSEAHLTSIHTGGPVFTYRAFEPSEPVFTRRLSIPKFSADGQPADDTSNSLLRGFPPFRM